MNKTLFNKNTETKSYFSYKLTTLFKRKDSDRSLFTSSVTTFDRIYLIFIFVYVQS